MEQNPSENLKLAQVIMKFPAFYITLTFTFTCRAVHDWSLITARWIQSTTSQALYLRYNLSKSKVLCQPMINNPSWKDISHSVNTLPSFTGHECSLPCLQEPDFRVHAKPNTFHRVCVSHISLRALFALNLK